MPEDFIIYLPSLIGTMQPIQYQSCFISDSSRDEEFARRLHEKMRGEKLRVWFAPEDMQGGQKLIEQIDRAIQVNDRLLLVLSEHRINSEWVKTELRKAHHAERALGAGLLTPPLDATVGLPGSLETCGHRSARSGDPRTARSAQRASAKKSQWLSNARGLDGRETRKHAMPGSPQTVHDLHRQWKPHKERLATVRSEHPTAIRFRRACSWMSEVEQLDPVRHADQILLLRSARVS